VTFVGDVLSVLHITLLSKHMTKWSVIVMDAVNMCDVRRVADLVGEMLAYDGNDISEFWKTLHTIAAAHIQLTSEDTMSTRLRCEYCGRPITSVSYRVYDEVSDMVVEAGVMTWNAKTASFEPPIAGLERAAR